MGVWGTKKASVVLRAIVRLGWHVERQTGSHRTMKHPTRAGTVFAYHDGDEIGPCMLAKMSKIYGFTPDDL